MSISIVRIPAREPDTQWSDAQLLLKYRAVRTSPANAVESLTGLAGSKIHRIDDARLSWHGGTKDKGTGYKT